MGIVRRLTTGTQTRAGKPTADWWFDRGSRLSGSSAGKLVTPEKAAGLPAVWHASTLLAESVAGLPLKVHTRRTEGGVLKEVPGSAQALLLEDPNPECTPFDLWQQVVYSLELWGNAYIGKAKVGNRIESLWPIEPQYVTPKRVRGRKVFEVLSPDSGRVDTYTQADIIHIKGPSFDGYVGVSPIALHRQTVGLGLALDDFGGRTIGDRAVPLGVLSVKGRITDPAARDNLRREWENRFKGRNRVAILDDGAQFQSVSMPLADAQYIEQRKMNGADVARIFRMAPEMIGYDTGGSLTYKTIESQGIAFVRYTLRARLGRIEQSLKADRDLFPTREGYLPRFDTSELQRGDTFEQYRALTLATGGRAFMTLGEARDRIGLDPTQDLSELDPAANPANPTSALDAAKATPAQPNQGQ